MTNNISSVRALSLFIIAALISFPVVKGVDYASYNLLQYFLK